MQICLSVSVIIFGRLHVDNLSGDKSSLHGCVKKRLLKSLQSRISFHKCGGDCYEIFGLAL